MLKSCRCGDTCFSNAVITDHAQPDYVVRVTENTSYCLNSSICKGPDLLHAAPADQMAWRTHLMQAPRRSPEPSACLLINRRTTALTPRWSPLGCWESLCLIEYEVLSHCDCAETKRARAGAQLCSSIPYTAEGIAGAVCGCNCCWARRHSRVC